MIQVTVKSGQAWNSTQFTRAQVCSDVFAYESNPEKMVGSLSPQVHPVPQVVGCNHAKEAFSITCTITAVQAPGLISQAQLTVSADLGFSYGSTPLIFYGSHDSYTPTRPAVAQGGQADLPDVSLQPLGGMSGILQEASELKIGDNPYFAQTAMEEDYAFVELPTFRGSCWFVKGLAYGTVSAILTQWTIQSHSASTIYLDFYANQDQFRQWNMDVWNVSSLVGSTVQLPSGSTLGGGPVYEQSVVAGSTVHLGGTGADANSEDKKPYLVWVCPQDVIDDTATPPQRFIKVSCAPAASRLVSAACIEQRHGSYPMAPSFHYRRRHIQ